MEALALKRLLTFVCLLLGAFTLSVWPESYAAESAPAADFPDFIPLSAEAEGVALDRTGNVYVSVREGGQGVIWKFSSTGEASFLADLGTASIGGLAVDSAGDVYAAMGPGEDRGVYRVDRSGNVFLLPGSEHIEFANALAFDRTGNLFVTESFSTLPDGSFGPGSIWRITPKGEAEVWLRHDLLTGTGAILGIPIGANGIAFYHGDLYVVNTDKGFVVRVTVLPNAEPENIQVWAELQEVYNPPIIPDPVLGDGLAVDVFGNIYVALVSRFAVIRMSADGSSQETVAAAIPLTTNNAPVAPLDTPASLAFGTAKGGRGFLFVTNLGWFADPGPGLVKIDAGTPGFPFR